MTNVIELPVVTTLDIPPERILSKAVDADLQEVIIIGTSKEGDLYFAGSMADGGNALWLIEKAKKALLE